MRVDKGVILAHKIALGRVVRWVVTVVVLPAFGIVTAFGFAPGTLVERIEVERVVQEVVLPAPASPSDAPIETFVQEDRVERGDTIGALLARLNVDDPEAVAFLRQAKEARSFTRLRTGRTIQAETGPNGELLALSYLTPTGTVLQLERQSEGFKVSEQPADLDRRLHMVSGEIYSSLFAATDAAGLADAVATQIAEIFSSQIDFHRDLRRGDRFAVVYESFYHGAELVRTGRVVAAEFINQGKGYQAIWFDSGQSAGGYYTPEGKSLRKAFLRSPLEFSRISSGFSHARFHPILQTWTAHRGIDYAAPSGTRVRTTADGIVSFAGWQGGYGNLVIVQHPGKYSTYYAHLSAFASGIRKGARVGQGDFVGLVGQTGLATGPHLHYEFHVNGVQHDPLRIVMPEAVPITRELRAAFDGHTAPLAHQLGLLRATNVARLD